MIVLVNVLWFVIGNGSYWSCSANIILSNSTHFAHITCHRCIKVGNPRTSFCCPYRLSSSRLTKSMTHDKKENDVICEMHVNIHNQPKQSNARYYQDIWFNPHESPGKSSLFVLVCNFQPINGLHYNNYWFVEKNSIAHKDHHWYVFTNEHFRLGVQSCRFLIYIAQIKYRRNSTRWIDTIVDRLYRNVS